MKVAHATGSAMLLGLLLAGCSQDTAAPAVQPAGQGSAMSSSSQADSQPVLQDVIETTSTQIIGISYPKDLAAPPGLARVLQDYADQARDGLAEALQELGNDQPRVPYELSLSFDVTADTAQLLAISADGSRYTGGAHGEPLMARFVWLKARNALLGADQLIADPASRVAVAKYVEDALIAQIQARLEGERLPADELASARAQAVGMIREGTEPQAENFRQFQPIVDRSGAITAVRFVFPPYQVGPYSDGTQSVDVPAAVMLRYVAPEYTALFSKD